MRKFFKRLGWVVVALLVLAVAAGIWKREELTRLMAVNSLFAEDRIVNNFSHMDTLFLHHAMDGGTPSVLPQGTAVAMPADFDAWAEARHVTATVVLHQGAVVHESYRLGTGRDDLRISWSVAKSALVAAVWAPWWPMARSPTSMRRSRNTRPRCAARPMTAQRSATC